MLVRLLPSDISKWWAGISESIIKAQPPYVKLNSKNMEIILNSLLKGRMDCWVLTEYDKIKNETALFAIGTTEYSIDPSSETINLSIFSLYSIQHVSKEQWEDAYDTLRLYAKNKNCTYVLGFTDNPIVVDLVNHLGGDTKSTLIKLEV